MRFPETVLGKPLLLASPYNLVSIDLYYYRGGNENDFRWFLPLNFSRNGPPFSHRGGATTGIPHFLFFKNRHNRSQCFTVGVRRRAIHSRTSCRLTPSLRASSAWLDSQSPAHVSEPGIQSGAFLGLGASHLRLGFHFR
jgi:hypothetical protein